MLDFKKISSLEGPIVKGQGQGKGYKGYFKKYLSDENLFEISLDYISLWRLSVVDEQDGTFLSALAFPSFHDSCRKSRKQYAI